MDLDVTETQYRDPVTGRVRDIEGEVRSGSGEYRGSFHFTDDAILVTSSAGASDGRLPLEPGLRVDDGLDFRYIVEAFEGQPAGTERTWRLLDTSQGKIVKRLSRLVGEETVQLDSGQFDCMVVENSFPAAGASGRRWIDRATGGPVQTINAEGTRTYLSDAGVRYRVTRGDLDALLLAPVGTRIEPVGAIRYMKVKARFRTVGEAITPKDLQAPGTIGSISANSRGQNGRRVSFVSHCDLASRPDVSLTS